MARINLLDFTLPSLTQWLSESLGEPPFRARQIWQWIWQKSARSFAEMTNVSQKLRAKLEDFAEIKWPDIVATEISSDGTQKLLLRLSDGAEVETVLIPAPNRMGEIRWTQCLSSQVGCPMGCTFCATGQMGFQRNMTYGEILGQVLVGKEILGDLKPDRPILRNLVFMGMGEPLLNLENLLRALETMQSDLGLNFSPRRITVSTCGISAGLKDLGECGKAFLAISLHAPTQELRKKIMPGAATWPLGDMISTLAHYPLKTRERITFEYLLLGGVNDSPAHARELVRLLSNIKAKINLIVYNPVPGAPYRAPTAEAVEKFQEILWQKNITVILRKSRGQDIAAACGQLKSKRSRPTA